MSSVPQVLIAKEATLTLGSHTFLLLIHYLFASKASWWAGVSLVGWLLFFKKLLFIFVQVLDDDEMLPTPVAETMESVGKKT